MCKSSRGAYSSRGMSDQTVMSVFQIPRARHATKASHEHLKNATPFLGEQDRVGRRFQYKNRLATAKVGMHGT